MAPAKSKPPTEQHSSELEEAADEEEVNNSRKSDKAPNLANALSSDAMSSNIRKPKAKYQDAANPVPDGVDPAEWYRLYNNANSYFQEKGTNKALLARNSGEVRAKALELLAKQRVKAPVNTTGETSSSQSSRPQNLLHTDNNGEASSSNLSPVQSHHDSPIDTSIVGSPNIPLVQKDRNVGSSTTITLQVDSTDHTRTKDLDPRSTVSAQEKDKSTLGTERNHNSTSTISDHSSMAQNTKGGPIGLPVSTAESTESNTPVTSMGPPYAVQTTSKSNKRRIIKHAAPKDPSESAGNTTTDKVKWKPRASKKSDENESSPNAGFQPPSTFFGRSDLPEIQPFEFGPSSVTDFDPKHPFKGKDSLPTPRQEFVELNESFDKMRVEQKVACDEYEREAPLEPPARSANDFNPNEKLESGLLKRFAGYEPFAKASPTSPISPRANSPATKQAGKVSKKKTNRGQKKKAAMQKKKTAAKEKAKDEKGKSRSTEPEEEDEVSEGASSDDGGEYCVCRGPDDHRKMIACDACNIWFHCSCVGVKEGDIPLMDKYVCDNCHVPDLLYTTWKPMCRLEGCRMPCNLEKDPPSKYCSDEHKAKFWEDAVARAPDGPGPSRGGVLTKGELKALLEKTDGDVNAFHALGKKPTLPTPVESIDWNKILTDEEKARMCQITADKLVLKLRSEGLKDKEKVVRMAMDRLKNAIEARKELIGVCGWDARLAMNEEEFQIWRNSQSGTSVFESGVLDETFCEKKRCLRHGAWVKLTLTECRMEDNLVHKQLGKLRNEEHAMKDRANTRAASQL